MVEIEKLKIVFMGTPAFAVASLRALVENNFNVVAIITATDKYGGRGGKTLIESEVKRYAVSQNIPVLQPPNLKRESFLDELRAFHADIQIVVAFRMLPEVVWNMPPYGTINLHGSLLPKYRGAAPINWAIIRGEKITGVTSFKLKHEIDTGDIIYQEEMPIGDSDTAGDVHDAMMELGAQTIIKSVQSIATDSIQFRKQNSSYVSNAPKLNRDNCEIQFYNTATNIFNLIRGLSPYPTAWFTLNEMEVKVYKAEKEMAVHNQKPGKILTDNKTYLKIACLDGFIRLTEIKPAGKKRMDIKSFLNGFKFENQS